MKIEPTRINFLDAATAARLIKKQHGQEANSTQPPESWKTLPRNERVEALKRSANRVSFAAWYKWYRETNPQVTDSDKAQADIDILKCYQRLTTLDDVQDDMKASGYGAVLSAIHESRKHLAGSAITFFREIDAGTVVLSEDELICLAIILHGMRWDKDDPEMREGLFLAGAYEASDEYTTNLWRFMKAVGLPIKPSEFGIITGAINDRMAKSAYAWRPMSMADTFYYEYVGDTIQVQRDEAGRLKSVKYHLLNDDQRMDLLSLNEVKDVYDISEEFKFHTGCPAIHAKVQGTGEDPNNPVKFVLSEITRAVYLALFPHHAAAATLRAATKITL